MCREKFGIENSEDWALHEAATSEEVRKYSVQGTGGPNLENLQLDMRGKLSSHWNQAVADLLLDLVVERKKKEAWSAFPERSDAYFLGLVMEQLERARTVWRNAQPKVKEGGEIEELDEVEKRMNEEKEARGKLTRATTRRKAVSSIPFEYSSNEI